MQVHAENNYEPNIPHPSVDEEIVRPIPVAKQEDLDELISIPFNFDWCKILNNLDTYRSKPLLTASTPNPSDDDDFGSDVSSDDISLQFYFLDFYFGTIYFRTN